MSDTYHAIGDMCVAVSLTGLDTDLHTYDWRTTLMNTPYKVVWHDIQSSDSISDAKEWHGPPLLDLSLGKNRKKTVTKAMSPKL